jgi:hypothetical protein
VVVNASDDGGHSVLCTVHCKRLRVMMEHRFAANRTDVTMKKVMYMSHCTVSMPYLRTSPERLM